MKLLVSTFLIVLARVRATALNMANNPDTAGLGVAASPISGLQGTGRGRIDQSPPFPSIGHHAPITAQAAAAAEPEQLKKMPRFKAGTDASSVEAVPLAKSVDTKLPRKDSTLLQEAPLKQKGAGLLNNGGAAPKMRFRGASASIKTVSPTARASSQPVGRTKPTERRRPHSLVPPAATTRFQSTRAGLSLDQSRSAHAAMRSEKQTAHQRSKGSSASAFAKGRVTSASNTRHIGQQTPVMGRQGTSKVAEHTEASSEENETGAKAGEASATARFASSSAAVSVGTKIATTTGGETNFMISVAIPKAGKTCKLEWSAKPNEYVGFVNHGSSNAKWDCEDTEGHGAELNVKLMDRKKTIRALEKAWVRTYTRTVKKRLRELIRDGDQPFRLVAANEVKGSTLVSVPTAGCILTSSYQEGCKKSREEDITFKHPDLFGKQNWKSYHFCAEGYRQAIFDCDGWGGSRAYGIPHGPLDNVLWLAKLSDTSTKIYHFPPNASEGKEQCFLESTYGINAGLSNGDGGYEHNAKWHCGNDPRNRESNSWGDKIKAPELISMVETRKQCLTESQKIKYKMAADKEKVRKKQEKHLKEILGLEAKRDRHENIAGAVGTAGTVLKAASPFLALIPFAGPALSLVAGAAAAGCDMAKEAAEQGAKKASRDINKKRFGHLEEVLKGTAQQILDAIRGLKADLHEFKLAERIAEISVTLEGIKKAIPHELRRLKRHCGTEDNLARLLEKSKKGPGTLWRISEEFDKSIKEISKQAKEVTWFMSQFGPQLLCDAEGGLIDVSEMHGMECSESSVVASVVNEAFGDQCCSKPHRQFDLTCMAENMKTPSQRNNILVKMNKPLKQTQKFFEVANTDYVRLIGSRDALWSTTSPVATANVPREKQAVAARGDWVRKLSVKECKKILNSKGVDYSSVVENRHLLDLVRANVENEAEAASILSGAAPGPTVEPTATIGTKAMDVQRAYEAGNMSRDNYERLMYHYTSRMKNPNGNH